MCTDYCLASNFVNIECRLEACSLYKSVAMCRCSRRFKNKSNYWQFLYIGDDIFGEVVQLHVAFEYCLVYL